MGWVRQFLLSSLGRKLIMSLTGLFLILFLIVHLGGNLLLLVGDNGKSFNLFSHFMTHNLLIELIAYVLYACIIIHALQGILIALHNRRARPTRYAVGHYPKAPWVSRQMVLLGILVFAFLCLHMGDFWVKVKFTDVLGTQHYAGITGGVRDLYGRVDAAFHQPWIVAVYLAGVFALGFHLWHGFDSAFQTLGLRHLRFGYLFRPIGIVYTLVISLGFTIIPLYVYFIR